jgi:DNA-binding transcriptional ArsR family regulator
MNANLDAVFAALADPTRRRIVERLARQPLTVGQIASEFPLTQPAISKHVRVLENAGLLHRTIEGRVHYCTLSPQVMQDVRAWIDQQGRYWNAALDRLDKILAKDSRRKKRGQ